jgi:hypothetical protein
MKFATVGKDNANKLCDYMNRNHSIIENKKFFFAAINGDFTTAEESQDYCKKIIKENFGKTCVFLSQGMATTSFSVSTIGNSVVFTDNELTSDDIQALHRSATWTEGKIDCNMIVITTNDSTEIAFDDIFEDETKAAKTREEKIQMLRVLLDYNSMIHFHEASGFTPVKITHEVVERVIDKKQQEMTRVSSMINVLAHLDEDIQEAIYQTIEGKNSTSKKSTAIKGDKFDPFGVGDEDKKFTRHFTEDLTQTKKQQILRAFVETAVTVPAVAREQDTTIEEFLFWDELNVNKTPIVNKILMAKSTF